jgi:ubiquinone biosynthesis protein UbiJ
LHVSPLTFDVLVADDGLLAVPSTFGDAAPVARAWRDTATSVTGVRVTSAGTDDTHLARDASSDPADVEITVLPDAIPALLRYGPSVLMKHVRIEGDAEFAQALGRLAEHLRWEPEEDLARWIGDAAAYRVVRSVRHVGTQLRQWAESTAGQWAEYLLDERPQLVRTRVHDTFGAEIAATAQRIQSLEARIARLEQQHSAGSARTPALPSPPTQTGAPR